MSFDQMESIFNDILDCTLSHLNYQAANNLRVWIDIKKSKISQVFGFQLTTHSGSKGRKGQKEYWHDNLILTIMAEMSRYASEAEKRGWRRVRRGEQDDSCAICRTLFENILTKNMTNRDTSLKIGHYLARL